MTTKRIAAAIGVLLALACAFAWGAATIKYGVWPHSLLKGAKRSVVDGGRSPYWRSKVSVFKNSPARDVVMLGDSITDIADWPIYDNQGIIGDTSSGVLERLPIVLAKKPKTVFLLIGFNDFEQGASVNDVLANVESIVKELQATKVRVVVQSVLCSVRHRQEIAELNVLLRSYCSSMNVDFIDLNESLAPNGSLDAYSFDGIHLNGDGCKVWAEIVRSALK